MDIFLIFSLQRLLKRLHLCWTTIHTPPLKQFWDKKYHCLFVTWSLWKIVWEDFRWKITKVTRVLTNSMKNMKKWKNVKTFFAYFHCWLCVVLEASIITHSLLSLRGKKFDKFNENSPFPSLSSGCSRQTTQLA